jgi:lysine 2,3-aminomutase
MVKSTEHFRLPIATAQALEKEVRGTTAGFNTPVFIVDTPGGKRDVHSAEFHDSAYGGSAFVSPTVAPGETFYYFDPVRSLTPAAREAWSTASSRNDIIARLGLSAEIPPADRAEEEQGVVEVFR